MATPGDQFGTPTVPGILVSSEVLQAGDATGGHRVLLIGLSIPERVADPKTNRVVDVGSQAEVDRLFGVGGQLSRMYRRYRQNDPTTPVSVFGVGYGATRGAATGNLSTALTYATNATSAGTFVLYLFGSRFEIPVSEADTPATVAAATVLRVNARPSAGFLASAAGGVVTLRRRMMSQASSTLFPLEYFTNSERSHAWLDDSPTIIDDRPGGMTATLAIADTASPGHGFAATQLITAMGERRFDSIVYPNGVAAEISAIQTELDSRWGFQRQLYGHLWLAQAAATFGGIARNAENHRHTTVLTYPADRMLSPDDEVAAACAGAAMASLTRDPAAPPAGIGGLLVAGLTLSPGEMYSRAQQTVVTDFGWTTMFRGPDGRARLTRVVSTATQSPDGATDRSWRDVSTGFSVAAVNDAFVAVLRQFQGWKLARDGARLGADQRILTPQTIIQYLIAAHRGLEDRGIVQNTDGFAASIRASIAADAPGQLNIRCQIELVSGLYVITLANRFSYSAFPQVAGAAREGVTVNA